MPDSAWCLAQRSAPPPPGAAVADEDHACSRLQRGLAAADLIHRVRLDHGAGRCVTRVIDDAAAIAGPSLNKLKGEIMPFSFSWWVARPWLAAGQPIRR